jgi:hypothetical protein
VFLGWFCVLVFDLEVFGGFFLVRSGTVLLLFSYWFTSVVLGLFWVSGVVYFGVVCVVVRTG